MLGFVYFIQNPNCTSAANLWSYLNNYIKYILSSTVEELDNQCRSLGDRLCWIGLVITMDKEEWTDLDQFWRKSQEDLWTGLYLQSKYSKLCEILNSNPELYFLEFSTGISIKLRQKWGPNVKTNFAWAISTHVFFFNSNTILYDPE